MRIHLRHGLIVEVEPHSEGGDFEATVILGRFSGSLTCALDAGELWDGDRRFGLTPILWAEIYNALDRIEEEGERLAT